MHKNIHVHAASFMYGQSILLFFTLHHIQLLFEPYRFKQSQSVEVSILSFKSQNGLVTKKSKRRGMRWDMMYFPILSTQEQYVTHFFLLSYHKLTDEARRDGILMMDLANTVCRNIVINSMMYRCRYPNPHQYQYHYLAMLMDINISPGNILLMK